MPFYAEDGEAIIPKSKSKPAISQTISDFKSGITPVERQIIDQAPKPSSSSSSSSTKTSSTPKSIPGASSTPGISQTISDFKSGITPVKRQIIDQGSTREEIKQVEASKLSTIRQITGHGKENIPEMIRDLGPSAEREYAVTAYKTQTGVISPEEGNKKIQTDFETRLTEGSSKSTAESWMKKHGTFTSEGKEYTWSELKEKHPRLEIDRYGGEFIISEKPIDYTAWAKEQYKDMNPIAANIRRGTATFLGGFASLDYTYASQTGDPTDIKGQQNKLDAVIDKWEYDTTHNIEAIGISPGRYFSEQDKASLAIVDKKINYGAVVSTIGNIPAVTNILAPYAMGVGVGAVLKGAFGASAAIANRGFKYSALAIKGTTKATGIGLGALAIGSVGADVYSTHLQDPDKATKKALTYGTQFFSLGIGMKTGSEMDFSNLSKKISSRRSFLADDAAIGSYYKKPLRTQADFYTEMAQKGKVWDYNQGGWTNLGSRSILETQKVPAFPKRGLTTMTRSKTGLDLYDIYPVYTAPKTGFSLKMVTGLWTDIFTLGAPLTYTLTEMLPKTKTKTGFSLKMVTGLWTDVYTLPKTKTKTQTQTQTVTLPKTKTQTQTQTVTFTPTLTKIHTTYPFLPTTQSIPGEKAFFFDEFRRGKRGARKKIHSVSLFDMNIKLPEVEL